MADPYHHGVLRATLMREALRVIERDGVEGVSLRALAREAGVSHSAPNHHFGSRTGLLTAIATEGPVVLDVPVTKEENCYPMIPAGQAARDMVG